MVREKMICHSIIGNSIGKEVIMKVNVRAQFISPLVNFSEKKINFCILKVRLSPRMKSAIIMTS